MKIELSTTIRDIPTLSLWAFSTSAASVSPRGRSARLRLSAEWIKSEAWYTGAGRAEELAEMERYIAAHGVTRCPTIYVEPTPLALPYLVEQARVAAAATRILRNRDRVTLIKRLLARASRRQRNGSNNWWAGAAPMAQEWGEQLER